MSKYDQLKNLAVEPDKTARLKLYAISVNGRSPTLILKSAGSMNKPYFNALLKRSAKSAQMLKSGALNAALIDENREEDRDLFPKFVLFDWEDMLNLETGSEIKYTEEEGAEFLAAIPDWMFDEIRTFAANAANFTETIDVNLADKAKNSQSG